MADDQNEEPDEKPDEPDEPDETYEADEVDEPAEQPYEADEPDETEEEPGREPGKEPGEGERPAKERPTGLLGLLRPRATKGQLAGALLCLVLGFAVAAQIRSTKRDSTFATARQDELVGILADLSQRSERLRGDLRDLETTKGNLERDVQGETAVDEARERATTYGLLAGTLPAAGPGIELLIEDPGRKVRSSNLLDALQELRDAGAEVIQVNDVRVGVDTYFLDARGGGIEVDGTKLQPPYRFLAIGDPHTLTTALNIPGGVMKSVESAGGVGTITQQQEVAIRAVRGR